MRVHEQAEVAVAAVSLASRLKLKTGCLISTFFHFENNSSVANARSQSEFIFGNAHAQARARTKTKSSHVKVGFSQVWPVLQHDVEGLLPELFLSRLLREALVVILRSEKPSVKRKHETLTAAAAAAVAAAPDHTYLKLSMQTFSFFPFPPDYAHVSHC